MTEQAFRELAEYEWQTYRYGYVEREERENDDSNPRRCF